MRHIVSVLALLATVALTVIPTTVKAEERYYGDDPQERALLDGVLRNNINGLRSCILLANEGTTTPANGIIAITMNLVHEKTSPVAAYTRLNRTGNTELASCLVRRVEGATVQLPSDMMEGIYIIRLSITEWPTDTNFGGEVFVPRIIGPYSAELVGGEK